VASHRAVPGTQRCITPDRIVLAFSSSFLPCVLALAPGDCSWCSSSGACSPRWSPWLQRLVLGWLYVLVGYHVMGIWE
jgi:hypothetical protein